MDNEVRRWLIRVFLFGTVLEEWLEGNAGITLAALLKFGPGGVGVEVGLEGH